MTLTVKHILPPAFASILLCFWYLAAIVGLNVHIDHHDGEVFVVSLLERTDCESLHPEDICHCVEHHEGHCHSDDEDCENEIGVISLTGDGSTHICDLTPASIPCMKDESPFTAGAVFTVRHSYSQSKDPPREQLIHLSVLRV